MKQVLCVCFQDRPETLSQSFIDHMFAWTGNTIQTRLLSPGPWPCERASVQHLLTEVFSSSVTNRRHCSRRHVCVSAALQLNFRTNNMTPATFSLRRLYFTLSFPSCPLLFPIEACMGWCAFRQTPSPSVRRLHGSFHEIFKVQ